MRRFVLTVITAVLTTLVATPSFSDDVTINLDSTTPYVDIPVTITEPVDATISTVTGTPQTNPGFIDSWIEVWQGVFKLAANDDGAHSATNVLASIITMPLTAGEYFIRATSYAYMCCNALPVGSYLLSTNLTVVTPSPTPTQTSSSPTPEPTPEPSSPSPSPSDTPTPTENPEVPVGPTQEPSVPDPAPLEESLEPTPLPSPDVQDTLIEVVDESFNDFPSSLENELPSLDEEVLLPVDLPVEDVSSIDEILDLLSFLPELSLENLQETLQEISESITVALDTVSNLGSDLTPEERKEAQQVVLGAIIVTQLSTSRRIK